MNSAIEIRNLEGIPIEVLNEASNLAFSDYMVPMESSPEQLQERLKSCSYSPKWSTGVFKNEQLLGFMFHGYQNIEGTKTLYNCGTGVIPKARGQALTIKQYQHLIPKAQARGIRRVRLEVISSNTAAVHAYKKSGFMVSNKLCCFKGMVRPKRHRLNIEVVPLQATSWTDLKEMWDWEPSWQHSHVAVKTANKVYTSVQLEVEGVPMGYAIYHPTSGRVVQFAIDKAHRMKGYGHALFSYIQTQVPAEVTLINVDSGAQGTLTFLKHIGLRPFLEQYDMELSI